MCKFSGICPEYGTNDDNYCVATKTIAPKFLAGKPRWRLPPGVAAACLCNIRGKLRKKKRGRGARKLLI